MSKKIKFAVIGCGHIGKRHAHMIVENEEAELVALIDIKDKAELGIDHLNAPFFNDFEQFLKADIDCDVVNIAVPNGLHASIARQALESGKDIVIEKPMTIDSQDAQMLIDLAKEKGRKIFVVMQNRYSPPTKWLKQIISDNLLGEIYMVQMSCFWNRDERYYTQEGWHGQKVLDGGTLFTQFSHFIDIMYWLFGDIHAVKSHFFDFNHQALTDFEDSGIVSFKFDKGGVGNFSFSTAVWNRNLESTMTIIAEKGSVKIGGQYMDKVEICEIKDYQMPVLPATNPGNDYGLYKGSAANHHYVIQNVLDVILRGEAITTTAEEGLAVVQIIEKMYQHQ